LERGELGNREAVPDLASIVVEDAAALAEKRVAIRLLARMSDPRAREALEKVRAASDAEMKGWATVGLAALGDPAALADVSQWTENSDAELAARAALATGTVAA